jgi:hypothetical protein
MLTSIVAFPGSLTIRLELRVKQDASFEDAIEIIKEWEQNDRS